jgi:hypothetical protein
MAWSAYLEETREATAAQARRLLGGLDPAAGSGIPDVALVDFDPDGEVKVVAAALYPHTSVAEAVLLDRVRAMSVDDRVAVLRAYVGDRSNRRHRPGRAFERTDYRFDIVSDYGAFRDLQRHRMLTIEWQPLTPHHGYVRPRAVDEAGARDRFDAAMARSAALHDTLSERFESEAAYGVCLAYRIRYAMQMNAREAMHLLELRTTPQGHPAYRYVGQQMHTLIAEQAGHRALAATMQHVDHSAEPELERLDAERRAEARRAGRAGA